VGLYINEDKTEYKPIKRANQINILLHINNFSFEKVCNFIYLGSLLNDSKLRQPDISERICKGNRAYYANAKFLGSKFLKINIKMKFYLNLIRPVVISASQTWTLNEDKNGLRICERQFLRNIFGPLIFLLFYVLSVLYRSVYCLLYMYIVLLPTGGYPIAVNKYIISYHITTNWDGMLNSIVQFMQ
jgi:hypothetical protein